MMETYLCRRIKLYNFLCDKGFVPLQVVHDKFNSKYYNWVFAWSVDLQLAIKEYYDQPTHIRKDGCSNADE